IGHARIWNRHGDAGRRARSHDQLTRRRVATEHAGAKTDVRASAPGRFSTIALLSTRDLDDAVAAERRFAGVRLIVDDGWRIARGRRGRTRLRFDVLPQIPGPARGQQERAAACTERRSRSIRAPHVVRIAACAAASETTSRFDHNSAQTEPYQNDGE